MKIDRLAMYVILALDVTDPWRFSDRKQCGSRAYESNQRGGNNDGGEIEAGRQGDCFGRTFS